MATLPFKTYRLNGDADLKPAAHAVVVGLGAALLHIANDLHLVLAPAAALAEQHIDWDVTLTTDDNISWAFRLRQTLAEGKVSYDLLVGHHREHQVALSPLSVRDLMLALLCFQVDEAGLSCSPITLERRVLDRTSERLAEVRLNLPEPGVFRLEFESARWPGDLEATRRFRDVVGRSPVTGDHLRVGASGPLYRCHVVSGLRNWSPVLVEGAAG